VPEPTTAAQLIALLREHPLTCGVLKLKVTNTDGNAEDIRIKSDGGRVAIYGDDSKEFAVDFGCWLTGALVEAHVERVISMPVLCWESSRWRQPTGQLSYSVHPTILHALLAGLESNLKETSK